MHARCGRRRLLVASVDTCCKSQEETPNKVKKQRSESMRTPTYKQSQEAKVWEIDEVDICDQRQAHSVVP